MNYEIQHPENLMDEKEKNEKIKSARKVVFYLARKFTGEKHPFKTMISSKQRRSL